MQIYRDALTGAGRMHSPSSSSSCIYRIQFIHISRRERKTTRRLIELYRHEQTEKKPTQTADRSRWTHIEIVPDYKRIEVEKEGGRTIENGRVQYAYFIIYLFLSECGRRVRTLISADDQFCSHFGFVVSIVKSKFKFESIFIRFIGRTKMFASLFYWHRDMYTVFYLCSKRGSAQHASVQVIGKIVHK